MQNDLIQDVWPHAKALKEIRRKAGNLSAERAAGRIGASRASWVAWEAGKQRPGYDYLKQIVGVFECPPEMIGYEPPVGWELVPSAWIVQKHDEIMKKLGDIEGALPPVTL